MRAVQEYWATREYQREILLGAIVLFVFNVFYLFMIIASESKTFALILFGANLIIAIYLSVVYVGIKKYPVLVITESSLIIGNQFGYGKSIPLDSIVSFKEEFIRKRPHSIYLKQKGLFKGSRINRRCLSASNQQQLLEFLRGATKFP